jgi:D-3-phosphoglycerate dehydrogenase
VGLARAHGIVIRTAPFTEADFHAAPHLRVIARHGVGVDNINVQAATARGVAVLNTPLANVDSVAEHALACMLALARGLLKADRATRSGQFARRDELVGIELKNKTLGIVGFGRIGQEVARRCHLALDMRILAYDPYQTPEALKEQGVEAREELEALLAEADVVSLHLPLTPETRGLISAKEFCVMKPNAFLLNLARGGVVDEAALHDALEEGQLGGAALDVFESEPPQEGHPLFSLENVILTPHSAAHTKEAFWRMATQAAEAVLAYLRQERPKHIINPQVLSGS